MDIYIQTHRGENMMKYGYVFHGNMNIVSVSGCGRERASGTNEWTNVWHKYNDESNTYNIRNITIFEPPLRRRYDNSTTGSSSSSSRHIAFSTIYKRICWALPSVITAHKTRRARELERQGKRKKNLLLYLSEILRASVIFHIFLYTHILYTHTCTIT